ncbi:MAG: phosphoribosylformylglycinamidine cyclo-ligase [Candidatus Aminicenantes bacterium]|nr:phosphoribosylformylglycinamidine cyclo-ligase [Candidatus Aminicenantes bacterium]
MAGLTYKKAGVDIDRADEFIKKIQPLIQKTMRPEVLGGIGGFSGLFQPKLGRMKEPVLVSSTDGVGTKLLIAELMGKFDTVGIDLVGMCVNDVVVSGAEPLFFLDYIACGKLDNAKLLGLVKGIAKGCREAGCTLLGGETAELPGLYSGGKFDLAGFCLGIVDRKKIIDGSSCQEGDVVIGLASNGLHSNGFSLVRKVFSSREIKKELGRELLRPTRIYVKPMLELQKKVAVKAMAHITGGGFYENIPRVIPKRLGVRIDRKSWTIPKIFRSLSHKGRIEDVEMFRTFNMGIGLAVIVSSRSAFKALDMLEGLGQKAWIIGELVAGKGVTLEG